MKAKKEGKKKNEQRHVADAPYNGECLVVKCPDCGSLNVTELDWDSEIRELEAEGITPRKVLFAGICMKNELPRYVCKDCKKYF